MASVPGVDIEVFDDSDYKPLPFDSCEFAYNPHFACQCCPDCGYPLKNIIKSASEDFNETERLWRDAMRYSALGCGFAVVVLALVH